MCQLFGYNGKERNINRELKEFYARSDEHPHGWGLATVSDSLHIVKEPVKAKDSELLKNILKDDINVSVALGHIRFATIGTLKDTNCHPFCLKDETGRNWVLVHNGTIFNDHLTSRYQAAEKGDTDSERILYLLVDAINHAHAKSAQERFDVVSETLNKLAEGNKLNVLLYDGDTYYVHSNLRHSLYCSKSKDGIAFCSEPLENGKWKPVAFNQVIGYVKGKKVFCGKRHNHEYVEDLSRYAQLNLDFVFA